MPYAANVPVALGGVTVLPGDWIHADAAGVVVIPPGDLRPVPEEAARTEERDAETVARMRDEDLRRPGGG